ncbi:dnaJ-like protein subfamily C member 30 [Alligator mississippiensis]|uniref:DnaJ homolog subfamily C member 30, mitochondrial n=1 Tax=Alligator mississippiensis TaxID=8496 RepID=A0A151N918_ALLMI|nr:dnaJ-like protein subfamily C member 30 [Alligator mississippiensis]
MAARGRLGRALLAARCVARLHSQNGPAPPRTRRAGLYELLGVPATASQAQIKAAYYAQSFRFHPDRNAGSEEAAALFAAVSEAYLVLGSAALRRKYDRGILSSQDLRTASRPSGRQESPPPRAHRPTSPRGRSVRATGRPPQPIFDFDAFYRAHYGEQLQREQLLRSQREELRKQRQAEEARGKHGDAVELLAAVLLLLVLTLLLYGN